MKDVTVGSRWWSGESKQFIVLDVVTIEDHTWVHYRTDDNKENPREYSCYLESFLQRFIKLPS